jgi:predicted nicotinamide N-methyase
MKTSTRTFEIPSNADTALSIQIYEDATVRADNLSLETWGSSFVLARRLHAIQLPHLITSAAPAQNRPRRRTSSTKREVCGRVLELGAGTGLVGISGAAIWKTNVTLTDLAPIVPALEKNIALNRELLDLSGGSASSGALDWKCPSILSLHPQSRQMAAQDLPAEHNKVPVILAADTIYDSSHPEMLVNVIKTWLKAGLDSRVLIAYPVRVAYLEEIRELWERIEGIGMELVEEGKEELPKKDWDDETLIEWCVWKWKH